MVRINLAGNILMEPSEGIVDHRAGSLRSFRPMSAPREEIPPQPYGVLYIPLPFLPIEGPLPKAVRLNCLLPPSYGRLTQMSANAARVTLRQIRIAGRQRHASTTSQAAEAASSTATKSKEAASNATSKASQGLTRVTSSAGPALSRAGQGLSSALGKIGGRTGRLISFAECESIARQASAYSFRHRCFWGPWGTSPVHYPFTLKLSLELHILLDAAIQTATLH